MRWYVPEKIDFDVHKKIIVVVFLYFGQFPINLKPRLHNSFRRSLPQYNLKNVFASRNKLSNLLHFKDRIPCEPQPHPRLFKLFVATPTFLLTAIETEHHIKQQRFQGIVSITTRPHQIKITFFIINMQRAP